MDNEEILIVTDVSADERFNKDKLAPELSKVQFYAGVPLVVVVSYMCVCVCVCMQTNSFTRECHTWSW
jgi:hypothetical protein